MGPQSQQALDSVLFFVIWGAGISLTIFLFMSPFMYIVWWVRKNNIKKAEELIEQNAQIIEEATFFKYTKKYNEIIQEQLNTIKELSQNKKKIIDETADLEKARDKKNKK